MKYLIAFLIFSSCSIETINSIYFTVEKSIRDRQTRDEITKETYWIRDTCYILHANTKGQYFVNDKEIYWGWCTNEKGNYWNLCDDQANVNDIISIDINKDGVYEQSERVE